MVELPLMHADSGGGGFTGHNSEITRAPWTQGQASSFLTVGQDLGFSRSQAGCREGGGGWG